MFKKCYTDGHKKNQDNSQENEESTAEIETTLSHIMSIINTAVLIYLHFSTISINS